LDAAIREGVTRDKAFGQGNGLYGTGSISQKSGGQMLIISGHAFLRSSARNGLRIGDRAIPFNGTLVISMIGYSDKVDLSDALVFGGKRHVPVDYIETHFAEDKDGNVTFVLKDESSWFGQRSAGEPVRRKLKNVVHALDKGRIIVDLAEIALVSSSYADEVSGKLFIDLGPLEFMKRIELRNLDPLVKALV
jgi:STAS-like domain of unknown function (DUF4325)